MGLRFSTDGSDSDSNEAQTTTERPSSFAYQRSNLSDATHGSTVVDSRSAGHSNTAQLPSSLPRRPHDVDELIRQLEQNCISTGGSSLFDLVCTHPTQAAQLASRLGGQRAHSMSTNRLLSDSNEPSTSTTSQRSHQNSHHRRRHRSHRTSWFGGEVNRRDRGRHSESVGTAHHQQSGGSDSEIDDIFNHTRLAPFLFRQHYLHSSGSHSRQAGYEKDLIRVMKISAAKASYNVDQWTRGNGECSICLVNFVEGDVIARLACLCVYHRKCIDDWFECRPVCPEHPGD